MKNIIIYYPFTVATNPKSGSALRPVEMLKAFEVYAEKHGLEVIVISGNSTERRVIWNKLVEEKKYEHTLFCYSENQTIPLWLTDPGHIPKDWKIDKDVFSTLRKYNIPIGVFYRDVYWKFDELYSLKGPKKFIMQTIYKMEEKFYGKYIHTVFLPSDAMGKYVNIHTEKMALPPGGRFTEIKTSHHTIQKPFKGIYVGGINNDDYGLPTLVESYDLLNKESVLGELIIVCREDEFVQLSDSNKEKLNKTYIKLKHVSGAELQQVYEEVDFAFIPRKRSVYNDFAVPIKLVEYLTAGLPIIATNCSAQEDFIQSGPYGVITGDDAESLVQGMQSIQPRFEEYKKNIQQSFLQQHAWNERAEQAARALIGGKK
ncbi:glycosyltransferase [Psychrobacillus vulpis]|uniref:Glycosyltransferase family 4 protein n=1 Tax=Psychrobacillus vulpis TaxID=2325572 RepID=A0A544TV91_9BACI|nr:glycosyltransferase [Psychrobacillus vulpis]TQR21364.1 glycosyltransferase family 4 protein [Psychrobacillus vulpis]